MKVALRAFTAVRAEFLLPFVLSLSKHPLAFSL